MRPLHFIFLGLLACLLLAALPVAGQVIKVEPRSLNFGEMKPKEQRQGSLTVTNVGGGLLELRKVEADCGCTTLNFTPTTLGPGQSTVIEIKFDSKNFSGRTIKMVHLESNDPINPIVDVAVQAMVKNPLLMDPPSRRIAFGTAMVGEAHEVYKTFTATEAPTLELRAEMTREGIFDLEIINGVDGHAQVSRLTVTQPADLGPGNYKDQVRVYTNLEDTPYIDLDLATRVVQVIEAKPQTINFRFKKEFKHRIRVAPYFSKKLEYKVTGVEVDLPGLEYEIIETIPNKETLIVLSGGPIAKDDPRARACDGKMNGTMLIFTDSPEAPVLEVSLSYMIRM